MRATWLSTLSGALFSFFFSRFFFLSASRRSRRALISSRQPANRSRVRLLCMYEIGRGTRAHEKRRGIERDEGVREDAPLSSPSTYKKPGEGREKKGKKVEGWEKGEGVERKRAELWTRKSEFGRISRVLQSAQAPGPDSGLARITRAGGVRGREVAGISGGKNFKAVETADHQIVI